MLIIHSTNLFRTSVYEYNEAKFIIAMIVHKHEINMIVRTKRDRKRKKLKWERWQGLKMINHRTLHGTKLDWCSWGAWFERWRCSAWVLRRSLAAGMLSAWVNRDDGVTCGHARERGREPPLMVDERLSPVVTLRTHGIVPPSDIQACWILPKVKFIFPYITCEVSLFILQFCLICRLSTYNFNYSYNSWYTLFE